MHYRIAIDIRRLLFLFLDKLDHAFVGDNVLRAAEDSNNFEFELQGLVQTLRKKMFAIIIIKLIIGI